MFRMASRATFALLCVCALPAPAHDGFHFDGPDGHAPPGVMGDHYHREGEWMWSYRTMRMHMDGNRDGTDRIPDAEVTAPDGYGYMVAPLEMDTEMHMLGAMYAASDDLTLTAMAPYLRKTMDHVTRMGERFPARSDGIGDVRVGALLRLADSPARSLHLNLGLSLPTGAIDERGDNPRCRMMNACPVQLPYPMQLGSGTFDPSVGLTWRGAGGAWSWGAQALATFRLGRNDRGYSQGENYQATGWAATRLADSVSVSARLSASEWGDYDGADEALAELPEGFVATADPSLRGGRRADAGIGLNWLAAGGALAGHRLAVEWLYPLYQDLDGPQLESDGMLVLGWQYAP